MSYAETVQRLRKIRNAAESGPTKLTKPSSVSSVSTDGRALENFSPIPRPLDDALTTACRQRGPQPPVAAKLRAYGESDAAPTRVVAEYRRRGQRTFAIALGASGQSYAELADSLRRRFGAVVEVRQYRRARTSATIATWAPR